MTEQKASTRRANATTPTRARSSLRLAEKIAAIAGELTRIAHDKRMSQGGENYGYASIDAIADLTRPMLAQHGIAVIPEHHDVITNDTITSKRGAVGYRTAIVVSWVVTDGVETLRMASVGEAIDYSDKSFGKAQTYARKALLVAMLNMSTGEDPDAHRPDAGAAEPPTRTAAQGQQRRETTAPMAEPQPETPPDALHEARMAVLTRRAERDGLTRADVEHAISTKVGDKLQENHLATNDGYADGQAALRDLLVAAGSLPG